MKVKVSRVFPTKEIEGVTKEGRAYKIKVQNIYASYLDGSDVRLSASNLNDLTYLEGKTIDLSGAMTSGEYEGKPQIKISKKTIIKVVGEESKPVDNTPKAPETNQAPVVNTESEASKWAGYFKELLDLGIPAEQAGPGASTIYIQSKKK